MSDRALSAAAQEVVHSLLGLGVAAATMSILARTWLLEVLGAIGSSVAACRGGVQPHTTTIITLLMPRAFSFQTAFPKTVRSERPIIRATLKQESLSQGCCAVWTKRDFARQKQLLVCSA